MNIYKNARLTFASRLEMIEDVLERKLTYAVVAAKQQVSVPTVRKWVGRYLDLGRAGPAGCLVVFGLAIVTGERTTFSYGSLARLPLLGRIG